MAQFKKGHTKLPNSGRKPGQLNRVNQTIREIWAEYDYDPVKALLEMLRDESKRMTLKERADIHRTLSKYGYAELKSIDISGDIKTEVATIEEFIKAGQVIIEAEFEQVTDNKEEIND